MYLEALQRAQAVVKEDLEIARATAEKSVSLSKTRIRSLEIALRNSEAAKEVWRNKAVNALEKAATFEVSLSMSLLTGSGDNRPVDGRNRMDGGGGGRFEQRLTELSKLGCCDASVVDLMGTTEFIECSLRPSAGEAWAGCAASVGGTASWIRPCSALPQDREGNPTVLGSGDSGPEHGAHLGGP